MLALIHQDKTAGDPWAYLTHVLSELPARRSNQRPDDGRHRFDKPLYRKRAAVEQCAGWFKENRAVGTRFDKLAVQYLGMVHLAMIRRYLRALVTRPDSADRA